MKHIFTTITAALEAAPLSYRWVDFDLGQLDQATLPPVSYPCALLRFSGSGYADIAADANAGILTVEVALAFQIRERTHSKNTETYRDEALEHLDTVERTRRALSGISGDGFSALQFSGFSHDPRPDLRIWRLRFDTQHYPDDTPGIPSTPVYTPWPGPGAGPGFCIHPDIIHQ